MFTGLTIYLLPNGLGRGRKRTISAQVIKHNGSMVSVTDWPSLTHVLVEDSVPYKVVVDLLKKERLDDKVKVVRLSWLFACLTADARVNEAPHLINIPPSGKSESQEQTEKATANETADEPAVKRSKFVCEEAAAASSTTEPVGILPNEAVESEMNGDEHLTNNEKIIRELKILADGYTAINDRWRALSYDKAIKQIQHYPNEIMKKEDVSQLRGIGKKIADKIEEIIESGHLRKADKMKNDEKVQTMVLFNGIWGVGPSTAEQWYAKGLRTLEDVKRDAKLTHQQEIGLQHYDEFLDRMPRAEAERIADTVLSAARELVPGVECQACGSFRRGKSHCGDVDIIVTHSDGKSHQCLPALVKKLSDTGFLTAHLVQCSKEGNQHKYMGVCRLPDDGAKHRRLDIITVPYSEYATSLIYFTGSAHFTRSIYAKVKSMGMKMNQHGLYAGVMRQAGESINQGRLIETPTEESVFEAIGLEYRTPAERDHP